MFYRSPENSVCADVIPFYENGEWKLFYLRDYRDIEGKGEGCPWCLLTTKDLVHYEDHGPVLLRGSEEEQDLYVFTGSVFKKGDTYYIFYTGHNPHLRAKGFPEQKILMATSKDLLHWDKVKDFVFEAPSFLEKHDFRDPFVYVDDNGDYAMLLAARQKNGKPINSKGVTLKATSKDLFHWTLEKKPFYTPRAFFTHECPDLFKMGDWYYLVFSEFTDKVLTTYRMGKTINGPWIAPTNNTFNGHAFYAAKSAVDENGRRIIFGWNPIKNNEVDEEFWQWGGSIIPEEIVQDPEDGTLYTKCPKEIEEAYQTKKEIVPANVLGKTRNHDGRLAFQNNGYNLMSLGRVNQECKIEFKFKLRDLVGDFGLIYKSDEDFNTFYKLKIEPKMNHIVFDSIPRKDNCVHAQVDCEKYCPLAKKKEHTLMMIIDGSCIQVYVDDKYALSTRAFQNNDGMIALYSNNIRVDVYDVKVTER
ncbi:MAG: family 43 glycosylhydrolase [Candidatus Enteromonas sp.]